MTSAVRELLRSFQSLSDAEKHEAASLLLRQVVQGEAGDVDDDALVAVAEGLFLDLDGERPAMANPLRGEVWLVDLGMVAKIRPCLVFSVPAAGPNDRVLVTVVAHTTSARGSEFETAVPARFLKPGVFDAQNIISIPHAKLVRRLGTLAPDQMEAVAAVIRKWLSL